MKVLHISSEVSWRGGEQQIAYLIQESRKNNMDIAILVRDGSAFQAWAEKEEVTVYECSFSGPALINTALHLKKIASEFDLIHAHSGKGHDVLALAYLFGLKTPSVLSRRVDFPVKKSLWASWKYNHPRIKKIICVSNAIRELVRTALKEPDRAVTVHSGVDLDRYRSISKKGELQVLLRLPQETVIIGVLAALAPHKDLFTFIDTCAILNSLQPNLRFVILGEGALREELEAYRSSMNLETSLFMPGFRNDALELLPDLDLFLISSKTEGLGTSIIDAMACGVPVVGTRAGGIPELVIHEQTGLLAEVGDAHGLAQAVQLILGNESLKAKMIEQAKRHILGFSYQETATQTIAVYETVLA